MRVTLGPGGHSPGHLRSVSMRSPVGRFVARVLVGLALLSVSACASDFEKATLGLSESDHGWLAVVEPGERFDVGLANSVLYSDIAWEVTEFDPTVIALESQEQAVPPSFDPSSTRLSHSVFNFSGLGLGETPLVFALWADGEQVDVAEFSVAVVEEACDGELGARANRCGEGFQFHPQNLTEFNHGWVVALEPGDELDVTLAANALYPDSPWQAVELDRAVIDLQGPEYVAPDRLPGDWSVWEPDSRHSFLARWSFTIVGVELGETTLVLDIETDDGRRADLHELVVVVEDACEGESQWSTCLG